MACVTGQHSNQPLRTLLFIGVGMQCCWDEPVMTCLGEERQVWGTDAS